MSIEYYANKISGLLKEVHNNDKLTIGLERANPDGWGSFYYFIGEFYLGEPNGFFYLTNEEESVREEAIYVKNKLLIKYEYSIINDTSILYDLERNGNLVKQSSNSKNLPLRHSFTDITSINFTNFKL
jgi:hypothetical protein